METEYRYFVKIWGAGGVSHGAYYHFLLDAKDYESAVNEIQGMEHVDLYNPISCFLTNIKTGQPLSQWEIENRKK